MKIMSPTITPQWSVVGSNGKGDLIELDQLFKPGDYISISTPRGVLTGRVVAMRSKSIELKSTGGHIFIPHSIIYSADIINHSTRKKYLREYAKQVYQHEENTPAMKKELLYAQ
ncbi:MAG: mechanosensitive ion channel [Theionarchaea archaeon]|nr:mechanosensitive ion channel [Theionarchaea archaeon]